MSATDVKIVTDFAAFCAKTPTRLDYFYDESLLPHSKEAIVAAMESLIARRELPDDTVEWVRTGTFFLRNFIRGVGEKPFPDLGVELGPTPRGSRTADEVMAQLIASLSNRERADHFQSIADREAKQIEERIVRAVRLRLCSFAGQGDADAQFKVGNMYLRGEGVPKDYVEAANWYRKAAAQGHVEAQTQLGHMYEGGVGVPQDHTASVSWFRKAAEQGGSAAQNQLGHIYAREENYAEAAKWCSRAAEQGNVEAQTQLGFMYAAGAGAQNDYVQAYKWLSFAASGSTAPKTSDGDDAQSLLTSVINDMTPEQIAEAQKLAREWKPKPER